MKTLAFRSNHRSPRRSLSLRTGKTGSVLKDTFTTVGRTNDRSPTAPILIDPQNSLIRATLVVCLACVVKGNNPRGNCLELHFQSNNCSVNVPVSKTLM